MPIQIPQYGGLPEPEWDGPVDVPAAPPVWGNVINPAAEIAMAPGDYLAGQGGFYKKKPPAKKIMTVPKTAAPPLELNLKAKMLTPWIQIKTLEEYNECLQDGILMEFYNPIVDQRIQIAPILPDVSDEKKYQRLNNGIWKHCAQCVCVFAVVKRRHTITGEIIYGMWSGRHVRQAQAYKAELGPRFIRWETPYQYIIWDVENEKLGF